VFIYHTIKNDLDRVAVIWVEIRHVDVFDSDDQPRESIVEYEIARNQPSVQVWMSPFFRGNFRHQMKYRFQSFFLTTRAPTTRVNYK